MKRFWAVLAMLCMLAASAGALAADYDPVAEFGSDVLNVYNWGEYIDKQVLTDFEKEYKVRVNYSLFSSNEEMYTKLLSGASYDVLVPSDYMIERLIKENKLQPLDREVVNNLDNLAEGVRNLDYDPDNTYSVPYLWQTVGIVYDTTKIDPAEMEEQGWSAFLNPEYSGHVYMYDSERDAFMVALKALGYSANTDDPDELQAAFEWLREMDKAVHPSYVTDEVIDAMANGEKWMALVYSGDAAYILSENEDMGYLAPKEGTNISIDAMVIPANATNPKLANVFIRYILEYDASLRISEEVGYASANAQVLEELSGEDGAYAGNDAYVPRAGYDLDEHYIDIPESLRSQYSSMWIKVKLHE
ncbi:MAG: ABC transporter substrate-binding protein [Clostridia bacterium]|nr:ABC transporter substrate-binding protein [Clostridia bacterium]